MINRYLALILVQNVTQQIFTSDTGPDNDTTDIIFKDGWFVGPQGICQY